MKQKEKIITARKNYVCDYCNTTIEKGTKCVFGKGRWPRYDDEDFRQIGITYYQYRVCMDCDSRKYP